MSAIFLQISFTAPVSLLGLVFIYFFYIFAPDYYVTL